MKKIISGIKANYYLWNTFGFEREQSLFYNNISLYRKLVKEMQNISIYSIGTGRAKYYYYEQKKVETFIYKKVNEMRKLAPFFEWIQPNLPLPEQIKQFSWENTRVRKPK